MVIERRWWESQTFTSGLKPGIKKFAKVPRYVFSVIIMHAMLVPCGMAVPVQVGSRV